MSAPVATGRSAVVGLAGCVFAWRGGKPVFIAVEGADGFLFLPLFSSLEKLQSFERRFHLLSPFELKQVDDGPEFLDSVPTSIKVILDPHRTHEGRVRYSELRRLDA